MSSNQRNQSPVVFQVSGGRAVRIAELPAERRHNERSVLFPHISPRGVPFKCQVDLTPPRTSRHRIDVCTRPGIHDTTTRREDGAMIDVSVLGFALILQT